MRTIKIILEYDGTNFVGWQQQSNGRSVQGVVEQVFSQLLQETVRLTGAGRTDSGVHARGQVAHFKTASPMEILDILRGGNALLPPDIILRSAEDADEQFHARYNARMRRYRYFVTQVSVAVHRQYWWFVKYKLDVSLLQKCANQIVGDHDFQSFCLAEADVDHYRCTVQKAIWTSEGNGLIFEIVANRFLHGMVRALVGTMVDVARGYRKVEDFAGILEAKDRRRAGMAAPPHGLFLEEVIY